MKERQNYGEDNTGNFGGGFRKWFLIGAFAILLAVLVGAGILLILSGVKEQRYDSAVKTANNYYSAGDYENAIVEYENAIAIDSTKESAWLNLISAYIAMEDYQGASNAVARALTAHPASSAILEKQELLNSLLGKETYSGETGLLTEEEINKVSGEISLENTLFDMVAAYTYTEYFRDFGTASSSSQSGGEITFYYSSIDLYTVYYDLANEKVLDADGAAPVAAAKPVTVRLADLGRIFSGNGDSFAVSRSKLEELFGDAVEFYQEGNAWYMTAEYKNCRLTIQTDEGGNIVSASAWNELEPLYRNAAEESEYDGEVSGYIQDAVTGYGMAATIRVRARGSHTGTVLEELNSSRDGSYTLSGDAGVYTIEVSAYGYITEYADVEIVRGQSKTGENVVLSPEVEEGEIRIVLTWNSNPADLDAYAIGTSSSGNSFNIHFTNKNENGVGNLDVDDTNGYGPETITITDTGASFTYSVMDYRLTGAMPGCGATVKVYLAGNTAPITYTVPTGTGVLWEVFSYSNGEITELNRLYSEEEISTSHRSK